MNKEANEISLADLMSATNKLLDVLSLDCKPLFFNLGNDDHIKCVALAQALRVEDHSVTSFDIKVRNNFGHIEGNVVVCVNMKGLPELKREWFTNYKNDIWTIR